jgi:hypothetical protein
MKKEQVIEVLNRYDYDIHMTIDQAAAEIMELGEKERGEDFEPDNMVCIEQMQQAHYDRMVGDWVNYRDELPDPKKLKRVMIWSEIYEHTIMKTEHALDIMQKTLLMRGSTEYYWQRFLPSPPSTKPTNDE